MYDQQCVMNLYVLWYNTSASVYDINTLLIILICLYYRYYQEYM